MRLTLQTYLVLGGVMPYMGRLIREQSVVSITNDEINRQSPKIVPKQIKVRTPSPTETGFTHPGLINTAKTGRDYLETQLLLVPGGVPATPATLSSALFQISAMARIPKEVMQVIRSVAWLLDEVEEDTVAATARDAVNSQLEYMNDELKTLTDHFRTTISAEVEKQLTALSAMTKVLEAKIVTATPYKDTVLGHTRAPVGVDLRVVARVGIRARQFIMDFPRDSVMQRASQAEMLQLFNKAMVRAEGEGEVDKRKVWAVEKLANKGFLGEFLHDDRAKWFTQQRHIDAFITALGDDAAGAQLKKRHHPVIAYYVLLNLNPRSMGYKKGISPVYAGSSHQHGGRPRRHAATSSFNLRIQTRQIGLRRKV
ncbi:hypothetical protein BYT27DRAFT_7287771 [Phlegmacium glaucopus]|nr:hypothetical protein BYT27DRAFT_7287771 [Phlegmacium glaucopus]